MSVAVEEKQFRFDALKWTVVLTLVASAIYANWYFSAESLLLRVIGLLVVLSACLFIASRTQKGSTVLELAVGARTELRKVVWPSVEERNQTTLIVVVALSLIHI